jgi:dihydropteroate synthase
VSGHVPARVPASPAVLRLRGRSFEASRPAVMAIVNRTPDSFWSGNRHLDLGSALAALDEAVARGADIVDVGGVRAGQEGPVVTAGE